MKKLLETLKASFIEALDKQLFLYMTIGSGTSESPMWVQMGQVKDGQLRFSNSQRTGIQFDIPVDETMKSWLQAYRDEAYDYFKYIKYVHIKENAPKVWEELTDGFNGNRINNFINNYNHNNV